MEPTPTTAERIINLLFVCVENSNRSQMAEAFARANGGDNVDAFSAGSNPSGKVNEKAIAAMLERGIDLSTQTSKGLEDLPIREWDFVVTMGCGDRCPHLPARNREDWELPDPREMDETAFAGVRNEIERRVLDLLARARVSTGQMEKV